MNKGVFQTIEQAEKIISQAKPEEQRKLLSDLPHLLKLSEEDLSLLKLAEFSFEFWNNPDDIIYDRL